MQAVKFNDLGYLRQIDCGMSINASIIGSTDCQIVVLLLLLPLLLIVMPVVLLMIRSNTIWSADRADRNLHDSISLFVVSSDLGMHRLHRHRRHHLHMFVWFNNTRDSIFYSCE